MNEKILVVDDERELADLLEVYLKNDGYTVYKYYNGRDALKGIEENTPDLAILDVMLPDMDDFRICQKIREKYYFPVIMLTAKIEDSDMDQLAVDITDAPGAAVGDIATLVDNRKDSRISAPRIAEQAGSISNELLSRMGSRLPIVIKE